MRQSILGCLTNRNQRLYGSICSCCGRDDAKPLARCKEQRVSSTVGITTRVRKHLAAVRLLIRLRHGAWPVWPVDQHNTCGHGLRENLTGLPKSLEMVGLNFYEAGFHGGGGTAQ